MLRDVYGDSVDKVIQGNTSNIVFLKSTDDSMLDTLQKMSGTTHRSYKDSKTVTRDMTKLWMKNEGKLSYTVTTREEPVIKYNDMAFISERNSIVFRAGDSPIWNRNETILPMSWRLFKNTIVQPGKKYTLQTIPTLSSAVDFDVRKNQPDFRKMLDKRIAQAEAAKNAMAQYQNIYDYTEFDILKLDPDVYADDIMDIINRYIKGDEEEKPNRDFDDIFNNPDEMWDGVEENTEQVEVTAKMTTEHELRNKPIYAGGVVSVANLVTQFGGATHTLDPEIIKAYVEVKGDMQRDSDYFVPKGSSLYSLDGKPYIIANSVSDDLKTINKAMKDEGSMVYGEDEITKDSLDVTNTYQVTDDFILFLASQPKWKFAKGRFEEAMAGLMKN